MNKEFVKKMVKAKKLECEAIIDIMPRSLQKKISKLEKDAVMLFEEIIIEVIKEDEPVKKEEKKNVKRIGVDFN